jgi:hypothetical protein
MSPKKYIYHIKQNINFFLLSTEKLNALNKRSDLLPNVTASISKNGIFQIKDQWLAKSMKHRM